MPCFLHTVCLADRARLERASKTLTVSDFTIKLPAIKFRPRRRAGLPADFSTRRVSQQTNPLTLVQQPFSFRTREVLACFPLVVSALSYPPQTSIARPKLGGPRSDLNRQPPACKAGALPIELRALIVLDVGWTRTSDLRVSPAALPTELPLTFDFLPDHHDHSGLATVRIPIRESSELGTLHLLTNPCGHRKTRRLRIVGWRSTL